jgi:hypothetical protein
MSKTVKNPKTGKPYAKLGEKIFFTYCHDIFGRWWWFDKRCPNDAHGPFVNAAEAEVDSCKTTYGEQCEVK